MDLIKSLFNLMLCPIGRCCCSMQEAADPQAGRFIVTKLGDRYFTFKSSALFNSNG
jgi:hypothetical protein